MSQLAKFVRQVETLGNDVTEKAKQLEICSETDMDKFIALFESLQSLHLLVNNELKPESEKLQAKMSQVDPVTGAKRYGQQTTDKLQTAVTALESAFQQLESLMSSFQERYLMVKSQRAPEQRPSEQLPPPLPPTQVTFVPSSSAKPPPQEEETEEQRELHRQAQELRERRQRESAELRSLSVQFDRFLHELAVKLHSQLLYKDLQQFRDHFKPELNEPDWKTMRSFIVEILRRVISKPDDVNLRRLRSTHPIIQSKLTQHTAGIALLLLLGFEWTVQSPPVLRTALAINTTNNHQIGDQDGDEDWHQLLTWMRSHRAAIESILHRAEQDSVVVQAKHVVDVLTASTSTYRPWDIIFEQKEPEIESLTLTAPSSSTSSSSSSSSSLSWIDWFDRLQASVSTIESMH